MESKGLDDTVCIRRMICISQFCSCLKVLFHLAWSIIDINSNIGLDCVIIEVIIRALSVLTFMP